MALSAWYGGLGPGLIATLCSVLLADYFLVEPLSTLVPSAVELIQLGVFALVAFLISWAETQRRQSEEALRRARDELQVILDGVADGITAQNADGKILFANQAAARLSGYPSTEAMLVPSVEDLRRKLPMYDDKGEPISASAHCPFECTIQKMRPSGGSN